MSQDIDLAKKQKEKAIKPTDIMTNGSALIYEGSLVGRFVCVHDPRPAFDDFMSTERGGMGYDFQYHYPQLNPKDHFLVLNDEHRKAARGTRIITFRGPEGHIASGTAARFNVVESNLKIVP